MMEAKKDLSKLNMIRCPKCGKYSKMSYIKSFGTCLCGEVLDAKAKYYYEMYKRLRLWRRGNATRKCHK